MTLHSGRPLIRANLMYSVSSTSSIADRVNRIMAGVVAQPSVTAGRMKLASEPRPATGSRPSHTAKISISIRPSQNRGRD